MSKEACRMMISTKGRYALRVMLDMAEHGGSEWHRLSDVAQRQQLSKKYLESIIKLLVRDHLLEGVRGKGGGYRLTRPPECYTVGSILRLTEDSMAPVSCLEPGAEVCSRSGECRTLALWRGLDKVISDYLNGVTLADLMHTDPEGFDYVI